jgi:GT2 family glycosyltransferase
VLYNDVQHLSRISNALKQQTYQNFTVYLLDNSEEKVHSPLFKKHFPEYQEIPVNENTGFAKGNNLLAQQAASNDCKYFWVLNPDMEPDPKALEVLVATLDKNPEYGAAGPIVLYGTSKEKPRIQLFGGAVDFKSQKKTFYHSNILLSDIKPEKIKAVNLLNGGSVFLRASCFPKAALFEERYFMYNDETDLMKRLTDKGYKAVVVSDSIVWHHHNWKKKNKKGYAIMYYYMMRNKLLYLNKFYGSGRSIQAFLKQVILFPIVLRFCIRTSSIQLVYYYYLGLWHGLLNKTGKVTIINFS